MIMRTALAANLYVALAMLAPPASAQALNVLWVDPFVGPVCAGPLGPGPCPQVAQWMAAHQARQRGLPAVLPAMPRQDMQQLPNQFTDPLQAVVSTRSVDGALECAMLTAQNLQVDPNAFLTCTRGAIALDDTSAAVLKCAEEADGDTGRLAECAGRAVIGPRLSKDQYEAVDCAMDSGGDRITFIDCLSERFVTDRLDPKHRAVLSCAEDNAVASSDFALCAGEAMFGDSLSTEARAAIDCAVESNGDLEQFGGCAANKFLQLNLNPEQQIALQCVMSSGGEPYLAAGCTASRLTTRELEKCAQYGIGGSRGCFGDNNDLVGRNGFVVRNIAGLAGGPNSVVRDPGQILGGPNSVFNNPRQLLGGPNSVPNQILSNIPSPPPIEVGTIGGNRICIPWC